MKGQTFMPDYVAGIMVFGIIVTIFLSSWNSVVSDQRSFRDGDSLRTQAIHTSTFLVSTPGYPVDWEKSGVDVEVPGFADPDHVLQEAKLEEFRSLSYDEQRRLLQARNFYMTVENQTGVVEAGGAPLEYGQDYSDAETIVPVTRSARLNKSDKIVNVELKYVVWQ